MKRLGCGVVGCALVVALNVSATVTSSCSKQGDDVRCVGTEEDPRPYPVSSSAAQQLSSDEKAEPPVASPRTTASSSRFSAMVQDSEYDDGCE